LNGENELKIILLSTLIFFISIFPVLATEKGEVCVSREEDNGVLNVKICAVHLQLLSLEMMPKIND